MKGWVNNSALTLPTQAFDQEVRELLFNKKVLFTRNSHSDPNGHVAINLLWPLISSHKVVEYEQKVEPES